eukprot:TRINITY_DN17137_c0_g1_i1.p1 TRINITY_DN17137_c0_g1~~TRINITY_DN17137_c0_g1_i1.p1  ORF type:complete len:324 (-),score=80.16 TRINITY_DN17137_c0_g1_i1:61-1032(-)
MSLRRATVRYAMEGRFLTVCVNPTLQKTLTMKLPLNLGEVNRAAAHRLDASGKGVNVSRVLAQLGARVVHLTQAGGADRQLFLDLCKADAIEVEWVESGNEIRRCYTVLSPGKDGGQHVVTEIVEEGAVVAPETEVALRRAYTSLLPSCHTVIISGSKAPGFSASLFPDMVKEAKQAGKYVVLDFRGADLVNCLPHRPDVVKPNFAEFCETFPPPPATAAGDYVRQRMHTLWEETGATPLITDGPRPTLYVDAHGEVREVPSDTLCDVVNTIGCGDSFTAGLAFELHQQRTDCSATDAMACAIAKGKWCATKNAQLLRPGVIM